jgi:hypothetical protein
MSKKKTRYLVFGDLTDCVASLEDFAQGCESFAERARALADAGFDLAPEQHEDALGVIGGDQAVADDLGLAE